MAIVARPWSVVIGVDTHAREHVFVAVDGRTGTRIETRSFPVTRAGLDHSTDWIAHIGGPDPLIAVEGTNSYGAILTHQLHTAGFTVAEIAPPRRKGRRGKNDALDAEAAARTALAAEILAEPRHGGHIIEAVEVLLNVHRQLTGERTQTINRLTAFLRRHDLGVDARKSLKAAVITTISRWRNRPNDTPTEAIIRGEATRLANRIHQLNTELASNLKQLEKTLATLPVRLGHNPGIGPIVESTILTAWSHHDRIHSQAAFARLAGIAPIEASSGQRTRHRLDRHGDRQLNNAIWHIAHWRLHHDPETRAYAEHRRTHHHSTNRDIIRTLKRYIARSIWRQLQHQPNLDTTP